MYGGRAYGSTYYAQAGGTPIVPPPVSGAVSPGGSGIPRDWLDRLVALEPGPGDELLDLIAVGIV